MVCFRQDYHTWGLSAKPLGEAHAARVTQATNIQSENLRTTNWLGVGDWNNSANFLNASMGLLLHHGTKLLTTVPYSSVKRTLTVTAVSSTKSALESPFTCKTLLITLRLRRRTHTRVNVT